MVKEHTNPQMIKPGATFTEPNKFQNVSDSVESVRLHHFSRCYKQSAHYKDSIRQAGLPKTRPHPSKKCLSHLLMAFNMFVFNVSQPQNHLEK